ncbi:MAG: FAD binding domain-containing protein [Acidobacteriaceae bacterium]|nr:FAD binding domain-containing protein [Acidobacteriaceae bacterium]
MIRFRLNGAQVESDGFPLSTTLLDYVRAVGLTGAKEGCAEGECGACTVVMAGAHECGSQYVPVNSCLIPLAAAAGHEVYTVEALAAGGQLCGAQQAMVSEGGSQCGSCTPGFVMSLFAEQYRPDRRGRIEVESLSGNLCRCTGYRPIRDAALSLREPPQDAFRARLNRAAPARTAVHVKCRDGEYHRPDSLEECLDLIARNPGAQVMAGGTDLMVECNLRARRFPFVVGIDGMPELGVFRETGQSVMIGAGVTLSQIGALWRDAPAAVRDWLRLFASPLIRNRATLGGNLATASPIGDAAPLLLAMNAAVHTSAGRVMALSEFFRSYRVTALEAGEIVVWIEIPTPAARSLRFYKVAKRRSDDISTVAAAFAVELGRDLRIESARFAYGGVAATPVRTLDAEDAVLGRPWNRETVRRAQDVIARTLKPISDHRGSAAYRLALAQSLLEKYWVAAVHEEAA